MRLRTLTLPGTPTNGVHPYLIIVDDCGPYAADVMRQVAAECKAAAETIRGAAGALAFAERIELDDEETADPAPPVHDDKPAAARCTASHTIEISDVEDKGARVEWVGVVVQCDKVRHGSVHSGLIQTATETVRWTWTDTRDLVSPV